jgi:Ca-activated chloride channel family protein
MQFADKVELLQDWTSAASALELTKALEWRYHPGESTAFYDGLYLAAEEQLKKTEGRRIIILLTDGIDTSEKKRASLYEATNAVRRAEASVYVVSLTASLREAIEKRTSGTFKRLLGGYDPKEVKRVLALIDESEAKLERLAAQTGGRMFLPRRDEELLPAYKAIAEELRTQYIITYKPKPRVEAGEWRRLRVLVLPGGYEVAAREGYKGRT